MRATWALYRSKATSPVYRGRRKDAYKGRSGPGLIQEETSMSTVYREKCNKGLIHRVICDPGLIHEGSGQGLIQEESGQGLIQGESGPGLIKGITKDSPRMMLVTLTQPSRTRR